MGTNQVTPLGPVAEIKEVVQRIQHIYITALNSTLICGILRLHVKNKEVLIKMPKRNDVKQMINLQQNRSRTSITNILVQIIINEPYNELV